jgi:UDP-GlcNAc:undecaprenyl-phosphate GlcNAc-1-phosphate transferase
VSLPAVVFAAACVLPALCISALATAAMRWLAPRWGLIDQPAARKVHLKPTPLGGGIGIWLGVVVPFAVAQLAAWLAARGATPTWLPPDVLPILDGVAYRSERMWAILGVGTVLAVMGLIDDRRNLPWLPRLIVQLAGAALLVIAFKVEATVFVPLPWVGRLLSILWILVLVNAFNFLDNMDGLSSGIGLIVSVLFAVVMLTGTSEPRWLVGGALLVLAGSIAGFLFFHNWPPARIFMGDSGSYFIGLMLSTLTILGTFYEPGEGGRHVILAPLCVLAVPLYDFGSVVLIRLSQGRSPFHPDKKHFSHRLVELGLKPPHAVLTIYLATLTTGLGALLLYRLPDWGSALVVLALIGCVVAMVAILETAGRRRP